MNNEFEIRNYDSKEDLIEQAQNRFLVYGNLDNANRFERINIHKSGFQCGIVYNYSGIKPEIVLVKNKIVFIGFDKSILCIDLETKQLISENIKGSLFYEFINIPIKFLIVVIFELDLLVMNYDGDIIWSIGFRDIIEDFNVEHNDLINIKCSDEEKFKFDLLTGTYID